MDSTLSKEIQKPRFAKPKRGSAAEKSFILAPRVPYLRDPSPQDLSLVNHE